MFNGPIFIVGRPRSGTKLIRDLLNQHPDISIPFWESSIIPHYAIKAKTIAHLAPDEQVRMLIDWLSKTEFYKNVTQNSVFKNIDKTLWLAAVTDNSYPGVVSAFFKLYASCEGKTVWGDKSPDNMLHLPLIKALFPAAKFIHIIRDIRDNCLSLKTSWGFHPLRGAQLWADHVAQCRQAAHQSIRRDYMEFKYEDLIHHPVDTLSSIYDFLELPRHAPSNGLTQPVVGEIAMDTRDVTQIVSTNSNKWRTQFDSHTIRKIEEIGFHLLTDLGYPISRATRQRQLNLTQLLLWKSFDVCNWFRADCREQGSIAKAIMRQYSKRRFG